MKIIFATHPNILRFILRRKADPGAEAQRVAALADPRSPLHRVHAQATALWEHLKADGRSLL